jgi:hypothetical protein
MGGAVVLALPAAHAQTSTPPSVPAAVPATAPQPCTVSPDLYKDCACLDRYLEMNPRGRFINHYKLEWGVAGPLTDPNTPPSGRSGWPTTPQTCPPRPFTEWPYGGATPMGVM